MSFEVMASTHPVESLPDSAFVTVHFSGPDDNDQWYDTREQYTDALRQFRSETEALEIARHEAEHLIAANKLGMGCKKFGLRVDSNGELDHVFAAISDGCIPKLGYAAIFAAPSDPSDEDINDILSLGYDGVDDVAERVQKWNRKMFLSRLRGRGTIIPRPLSRN